MQVHGVGGCADTRAGNANSENRLTLAAHEFEGQMLKELLKPLASGGGGGGDQDSGGILEDFAAEALGRGLSERGGLGIARQIVGQLSQDSNRLKAAAVTGDRHLNTGMGTLK